MLTKHGSRLDRFLGPLAACGAIFTQLVSLTSCSLSWTLCAFKKGEMMLRPDGNHVVWMWLEDTGTGDVDVDCYTELNDLAYLVYEWLDRSIKGEIRIKIKTVELQSPKGFPPAQTYDCDK